MLEVWQLDLASHSVKQFALKANTLPRLDASLENAGLATGEFRRAQITNPKSLSSYQHVPAWAASAAGAEGHIKGLWRHPTSDFGVIGLAQCGQFPKAK